MTLRSRSCCAAITANVVIFVAKLVTYMVSGSRWASHITLSGLL